MNIQIRPYQAKDKANVIRLLVDLQDHVARIDPWKRNRTRGEFDGPAYVRETLKVMKPRDRLLVATDGQWIVGTILVHAPRRSRVSDLTRTKLVKPSGRVEELIVDQRARGQGVGKLLVKAAEDYLRKIGCGVVFIGCFATNTKTLEFYKSQGYIERNIEFAKRI